MPRRPPSKSFTIFKLIDLGGQTLIIFLFLLAVLISFLFPPTAGYNIFDETFKKHNSDFIVYLIMVMACWQPIFSGISFIIAPPKYPFRIGHFLFIASIIFVVITFCIFIGFFLALIGMFVWPVYYFFLTVAETIYCVVQRKKKRVIHDAKNLTSN